MTMWETPRVLRLLTLAGLLLLSPAEAAPAADGHKQILVLYSTRRDSEFSAVGEGTLPLVLDSGLDRELDYYSEFIDSARFPDPAYQLAFGDFLRTKYQNTTFDLVIAMHSVAIEFVDRHREQLFARTPLVFFSSDPTTRSGPNSTGVIVERRLASTVSLIEQLQPGARVVSHDFDMGPDWPPDEYIKLGEDGIYLWIMPPMEDRPGPTLPPH